MLIEDDSNVEVRWGRHVFELTDLGENLIFSTGNAGKSNRRSLPLLYKASGARPERDIYNFMLDEHQREGYTGHPPYMVNHDSCLGLVIIQKFKEDTFTE